MLGMKRLHTGKKAETIIRDFTLEIFLGLQIQHKVIIVNGKTTNDDFTRILSILSKW